MKELIEKIGLNEELSKKVLSYYENHEEKVIKVANKCKNQGFSALNLESDLSKLAICLYYTNFTKEKYKKLGIPDDIFFNTMKDISIWCENNDNKGLKNYPWIKNHLNAELFKIGRLQFQFFTCNIKHLNYDLMPINFGDKVIYIHIPQGEKLIYSDCIKSIQESKKFFEKYFPEYAYNFYFCESWLLYDENYKFMKSSSNILQFQSLFDIVASSPLDFQAIERIYGKRHLNKKKYSENTSLQKSAKEYMLSGNKLGIGIGIINKENI